MPPFVLPMIKVEDERLMPPISRGASAWKPFCRSAPGDVRLAVIFTKDALDWLLTNCGVMFVS